jgi:single-strand DNA-binding protein
MLQATAIGYLGNDATIKEVNGKTVTNFSIAHSEKYKNAAGTVVEKTTWVECECWEVDKITPFLKKGTQVHVQGQPEARGWINKDGEAASTLRIRVSRIELLGGAKKESMSDGAPARAGYAEKPANVKETAMKEAEVTDDLPF